MRPTKDTILEQLREVDERLVDEHLARLDDDYFQTYRNEEIVAHIQSLSKVTAQNPIHVSVDAGTDGLVHLALSGFDYPSEFSFVTGILAVMGFSIMSGQVFVYAPSPPSPGKARRNPSREAVEREKFYRRRRFIEHLSGTLTEGTSLPLWEGKLFKTLKKVVLLLEEQGADGTMRARQMVNEMVAEVMRERFDTAKPMMAPVQIDVDNSDPRHTLLKISSQDTPAFLYSLSNALALRGIVIEGVQIETVEGLLHDQILIVDAAGKPVTEKERIDQLKLSVLLTKQFTYYLGTAPDTFSALSRFDHMMDDILSRPEHGQWLELLSDDTAFHELAKILGASDYLWEDFIRAQYETFLPILQRQLKGDTGPHPLSSDDLDDALRRRLAQCGSFEEKRDALNEFKNSAIFQIDLEHILHTLDDIRALAVPLTRLAEVVVTHAAATVYEMLVAKHGVPRTVGGLEAKYAVMGLGKLGGEALGYASDIELLFVYSDSGTTDGEAPLENAEFFDELVTQTSKFIVTKQEGIFQVDLRLRPYGDSGHKACSLESFCNYYGTSEDSHSYERLALVRMRAVSGDPDLGAQIERLRDEFIYESRAIDMKELQLLREKQFEHKTAGREQYNAKFSQGALVDIEYYVQILQVVYGGRFPELRTPKIHEALIELADAHILKSEETEKLTDAYYFLRRLINGLRMLRGNALDLFLPPEDSDEFDHLGRRMGYRRQGGLGAKSQLRLDFETSTAVVRTFIERHFGRDAIVDPAHGNVVDLVLSKDAGDALKDRVLGKVGFANIDRAYVNLLRLSGSGEKRHLFARLAVLACDVLKSSPDPDMALNNWERFVDAIPDIEAHYRMLIAQPRRLEILLGILAGSQFLADTLVKNPDFLDWVTDPANLRGVHERARYVDNLSSFIIDLGGMPDFLNGIRRFRQREILRIGTRDMYLQKPVQEVVRGLSQLADTIVDASLKRVWELERGNGGVGEEHGLEENFCIMAIGKLGGCELNYSSDIDLLCVYDDAVSDGDVAARETLYARVMNRVGDALSGHTEAGYVYRVDFRLRPHGGAGKLIQPLSALIKYYDKTAELWEIQAMLKLRPIAGNLAIGERLVGEISSVIARARPWKDIVHSIREMRAKAIQQVGPLSEDDVKTGIGGIRDIEFLVQGLQLYYLPTHGDLYTGNTLDALMGLRRHGLLPSETANVLSKDYLFLRRTEHYLQIMEDRQTHLLPKQPAELTALSKRLFGADASADELKQRLEMVRDRTQRAFAEIMTDTPPEATE